MTKRIQIATRAESYSSGQPVKFTMPKAPISKIILSGTVASDCTGNVTANAEIEWIKIRINGKIFIDLESDQDAGAVPWWHQLLREFYQQRHFVAMPDNQWIIELPDALPNTAQIDLLFKWASYTQAGCSSNDLTFNLDILYEMEDKIPGKVVIPYFQWDKFDHGTKTGHQVEHIPALPFKLRAILMACEDNGSLDDTAYADIQIKDPSTIYFDGKMIEFEALQEAKSRKALTAGMYIYVFPNGIVVPPNTLSIDLNITSAGTDTETHLLYICY